MQTLGKPFELRNRMVVCLKPREWGTFCYRCFPPSASLKFPSSAQISPCGHHHVAPPLFLNPLSCHCGSSNGGKQGRSINDLFHWNKKGVCHRWSFVRSTARRQPQTFCPRVTLLSFPSMPRFCNTLGIRNISRFFFIYLLVRFRSHIVFFQPS